MSETQEILLIFLSSFLALFLVLSVIVLYKIIQITNSLKNITDKAEHIANNAETISDIFVKSSGPLAVGKLLSHLAESVFQRQSKNKKEK